MTHNQESGEWGVVAWVQGVGLLVRVTTSSMGCWSTFSMAFKGQEEPFSRLVLAV